MEAPGQLPSLPSPKSGADLRTHTGEKSFTCVDYALRTSNNSLKRHQHTHIVLYPT